MITDSKNPPPSLPRRVAVIGAAGGLGNGILQACRELGINFTAIVRSRPERISDVPEGSQIISITSLSDKTALAEAFSGCDAVLTAMGMTKTSSDSSALLSLNMENIEGAMLSAGVDRILIINTMVTSPPGESANWFIRIFSALPGARGRASRELQAVVNALGSGALPNIRWTLVRASVNSKGIDQAPVATKHFDRKVNSFSPVSYHAMGQWMLEEAAGNKFVHQAPVVSRGKS
ncbi:MAG: NAD(P)-dependent oxidoreductase [Gammaproteobacteria bacterium]